MHYDLQASYPEYYEKVKFYMDNVRNLQSVNDVMIGVDMVNVVCSRGSAIPSFIVQVKNGRPITIANPKMTRLLMNLA